MGLQTGESGQTEQQNNQTEATELIESEINGILIVGNDGVLHSDHLHRISLRSRAEQDIVNDAKRKKVILQMCEDQDTEEVENGFSLARLKGMQSVVIFKYRHLSGPVTSGCHKKTECL
jgi:hypothetical protein